jgi:acyl carrier protein
MTRAQLRALLLEVTEAEEDALQGEGRLDGLSWDSMAVLSFMARIDQELGITLPVKQLAACRTLGDIEGLLGPSLQA